MEKAKKDQKTTEPPKAKCPVTRKQFLASAKPIAVTIDGQPKIAVVKEFSTGSLGWMISDKATIEVDGVLCKVQVGLNLTIVGSKEQKE